LALPAWLAVTEQVPAASSVAVVPETVQTAAVDDVKVTASPELAVAMRVIGAEPKVTLGGTANVMVCGDGGTGIFVDTSAGNGQSAEGVPERIAASLKHDRFAPIPEA